MKNFHSHEARSRVRSAVSSSAAPAAEQIIPDKYICSGTRATRGNCFLRALFNPPQSLTAVHTHAKHCTTRGGNSSAALCRRVLLRAFHAFNVHRRGAVCSFECASTDPSCRRDALTQSSIEFAFLYEVFMDHLSGNRGYSDLRLGFVHSLCASHRNRFVNASVQTNGWALGISR